jgi:hypothetical protein
MGGRGILDVDLSELDRCGLCPIQALAADGRSHQVKASALVTDPFLIHSASQVR